jgi:SAM-dependent methyltransferase
MLYNKLLYNCNKYNSNIEPHNTKFNDFVTDKKFDIIIFNNSFHIICSETTYKIILQLLKPEGIIYIQQALPNPSGWGDDRLNINSDSFVPKLWTKMKTAL